MFELFYYRQWHKEILLMVKSEAIGYPMFNFLPVRLPPVLLDFTSPDANIHSVK